MKSDLVLKIIMSANDKASKAFERAKNAAGSLNIALNKTQKELSETEKAAGKLSKLKKNVAVLEETRQKHRSVTESIKKMRQEMRASGQATAKQKADYTKLHERAEKLRQKQVSLMKSNRKLTGELNESGLEMKTGAVSAKSLAQAEDRLKQKNDALTASLEKQRRATERLDKARQRLNNAAHIASAAGITAIAAQNRATALARPLIATSVTGADFEKDFSRVVALQRLDKTKKEDAAKIAAQRQQALDLGATTAYTSGQVAQGQGYLAMAGFSHDQILKAAPHTLNLGTAAGMQDQLGEVANLMSNIMSGFGIAAEQTERAADVLTATFTNTNTNLSQLGETSAYAAPIMKAAGQSYESTLSMAGLLGNIGIQGSMAGTTLKNLATNLVNPKVIKELKGIGVSTTDKDGSMRQIPDILADIGKEINRLPNGKKLAFIEDIFGKIPLAGATELIDQLSSGKAAELFDKIKNSQGATQTTANIMADNTHGDWAAMKSAAEAVQISLFDQQSGVIRGLLQDVTAYLRSINEWIKTNPEWAAGMLKAAVVIGILLTAVAGIATVVASVVLPIATLRFAWVSLATSFSSGTGLMGKTLNLLKSGFWKLLAVGGKTFGLLKSGFLKLLPIAGKTFGFLIRGILMVGRAFFLNPIGLAITIIVGALYVLWRNWDTVKAALIAGWEYISTRFADNPIVRFINKTIKHFKTFGFSWDSIKAYISQVWELIKRKIAAAVQKIRDKIASFKPLDIIKNGFNAVLDYLGTLGSLFFQKGKTIAGQLIDGLKSTWSNIKSFFTFSVSSTSAPQGYSAGGYTGAGGANQPAGIVHKGEVVFSQRDIARFGGWQTVERLRRGGLHALQTLQSIGSRTLESTLPSAAAHSVPVLAGTVPVRVAAPQQNSAQNIVINIHGGSQSPQDIAREVARQIEQQARNAARRARSALYEKD